eukprot:m.115864 g.115864  ORF g.115864 m.115864 type:complete len:253 (-) comp15380_c0_seq11:62-820(-)
MQRFYRPAHLPPGKSPWTLRCERALEQRLYLMRVSNRTAVVSVPTASMQPDSASNTRSTIRRGPRHFVFKVMGNSGLPYAIHVREQQQMTCSCPDFVKRQQSCKHIIFLLLRVLEVSMSHAERYSDRQRRPIVHSDTLNLCENFVRRRVSARHASSTPERHASSMHARSSQIASLPSEPSSVAFVPQKPLEPGDACPVCFEEFAETKSESLLFCKASCGNTVHQACFKQWVESQRSTGKAVTCVLCRADWID